MARTRALLVDDVEDFRLLLRLKLEETDAVEIVGEASDGEEAIERAAALQPDLVLLDLDMPVMDGLAAIPHLARVAPGAHIVVLTGCCGPLPELVATRVVGGLIVKGGNLDQMVEESLRAFELTASAIAC
jgi:DNA-binding NarL/FixJ family response regulator